MRKKLTVHDGLHPSWPSIKAHRLIARGRLQPRSRYTCDVSCLFAYHRSFQHSRARSRSRTRARFDLVRRLLFFSPFQNFRGALLIFFPQVLEQRVDIGSSCDVYFVFVCVRGGVRRMGGRIGKESRSVEGVVPLQRGVLALFFDGAGRALVGSYRIKKKNEAQNQLIIRPGD
jgi:hypothetical protein